MFINLKLDKDFENQVEHLKAVYGENFERMNGFHDDNLNFTSFIDNLVDGSKIADSTIDGSANSSTKDVSSLVCEMMKPHTKLLGFNKLYYEAKKKYDKRFADEWLSSEWDGTFYMHNATDISLKPYCFAYDLTTLLEKGLFFNDGMPSKPAKHLNTWNEHVLQFVSYCSKLSTGAVGLPNYLVYSFYFWKHDVENNYLGCSKDPNAYRDQYFQSFIYNMNQTLLRVNQSAFTNISIFDRCYYNELFGGLQFPDGTFIMDYVDEFMEHQKAFMRVVAKVREEQQFTFPVFTYSLLYQNEKFVDEDFAKWCIYHNCKWSDSNIYNGSDVSTLSNCCRLLSDQREMGGFINSVGGTGLSIGSLVVNTINLRRLAIESYGDEDFFIELLKHYTEISGKIMDVVRDIIKRNIEKGLLPNYENGLIDISKQFNTLGILGLYECMREFGYIDVDEFGNHSYSENAMKLSSKIFEYLNYYRKNTNFDYPINIESVPAERASVVLCNKDIELYGNKFDDFLYSNQWIPLMEKCTIDEKIRLGSILDKQCGGGAISHINITKPFSNPEQAWIIANEIARRGLIYYAFNTETSIDKEGHSFYGETCPKDGNPVIDYTTRIVGFLVPTSNYSKERKKEFNKREWFNLTD